MANKTPRRQIFELSLIILGAICVQQALQWTAPIGRDIGFNNSVPALLQDETSPSQSAEHATLTLVIFTDYQCPACKLANTAMNNAVRKDGRIRIIYRDWPVFGEMSERAARVAIAADRQGIYSAVHTHLMDERRKLTDQVLREAVTKAGGNWPQIERDLETYAAEIESQLARNRRDAFKLGLSGTPAYLSGPRLVSGGLDEAEFTRLFAQSR